ncbi:MAG: patatin, partial [Bacteroidota bacterium]
NSDIVINATELRTGSAFRFGSRESGCWRFGKVVDNRIPVAKAVAASAAYPAFLPAIDEKYTFVDGEGVETKKRTILTDGGVYDNLGISCLDPDKSTDYSFNVFKPKYIICCSAGQGLFQDNVIPYFALNRMKRSFNSVFRKSQDSGLAKLHQLAESGKLKGFILPYLGQLDKNLPLIPPDLVRREQVFNYPTDFSQMSIDNIQLLSRRGEQLTRLLIERYVPEL